MSGAEFDPVAEHFDALAFWDRIGELTAGAAGLRTGDTVVDACCGTGSSALPAGRAVGYAGRVVGLDVSEEMLARGRERAALAGLGNVRFERGDIMSVDLPDASADAVLCQFGVFFATDRRAATAELWRLVRPGGRLVVTTWADGPMEPAMSAFREAALRAGASLPQRPAFEGLTTPADVEALLRSAGAGDVSARHVPGTHPLRPEDWWAVVLGSGIREVIAPLDEAAREALRADCEAALRAISLTEVRLDVVIGIAQA